jgi:putative protease
LQKYANGMNKNHDSPPPEILAPAGNRRSFLAAIAAGADAVYCGLKQYSARMAAKNFSAPELAALTGLAHEKGVRVYVTVNTLIKPGEVERVADLVSAVDRQVRADGIIIQDPGTLELARQIGFTGEIHLSTLANVSFPAALAAAAGMGVHRVVLPRELTIDEIRSMAAACPAGFGLEVFVHGALCYGVSGRCYWSSYLGGKSGLRGRCVQPCRRRYRQQGKERRFFSCLDLSLDVLAKVLRTVPEVMAWKIEGRKKGPHYVYHTVQAYRMLRDEGTDPAAKKEALSLLSYALGRPATHYRFLSQRPWNPIGEDDRTGSGLMVGRIKGGGKNAYLAPSMDLLAGDVLRIGFEDDRWHGIRRLGRFVPKGGRYTLKFSGGKAAPAGTPVFLTDRIEKALDAKLSALDRQASPVSDAPSPKAVRLRWPAVSRLAVHCVEVALDRACSKGRRSGDIGCWLEDGALDDMSEKDISRRWWVLPPVIWPENEPAAADRIGRLVQAGACRFMVNAPWQTVFFSGIQGLEIWAGPFCNLANPMAIAAMGRLGVAGAVVSPELGQEEYLDLAARRPLPLGIVLHGFWPLCVSRTAAEDLQPEQPVVSPRGEQAWVRRYGPDHWVFPNWPIDLRSERALLQKAGYSLFLTINEPVPEGVSVKKRPGLWNWAHPPA